MKMTEHKEENETTETMIFLNHIATEISALLCKRTPISLSVYHKATLNKFMLGKCKLGTSVK